MVPAPLLFNQLRRLRAPWVRLLLQRRGVGTQEGVDAGAEGGVGAAVLRG
jgi:hypothetical protein